MLLAVAALTLHVWPGAPPGSEGWTQHERVYTNTPLGTIVQSVTTPTLTAYLPDPSKRTGTGVIVAPGGSCIALAMEREGETVARSLQQHGIAAFVLKYRIPEKKGEGIPKDLNMDQACKYGMADGIRAVQLVREHARAWGISPQRVGFMGFSAGGMIASAALLNADASARPNFGALIYGAPFGTMPLVPSNLPPIFMAWARDDPFARDPFSTFAAALRSSGNAPDVHEYADGGHGFALQQQHKTSDRWIVDFYAWLDAHGFGTSRQRLNDAWWTGPIVAAGANTLPRGHTLIEPYFYDVVRSARYNANGTRVAATRVDNYGSLTYLLYGLTDRFTVGMIPTFAFTAPSGGLSSSHVGMGDLSLLAQYRLLGYRPGSRLPIASLVVQETLPTARYDRLGDTPSNGFGGGAYTTMVSLYTQSYLWMPNGRILRVRVNASQAASSFASVDGVSVYGTSAGFHGTVKPGDAFTLSVSGEYSVTKRWVLALDTVTRHDGSTRISDGRTTIESGDSRTIYVVPAVEYNWSPNVGAIAGVRLTPAGRNTSATVTPVMAINIVR